MTNQDTIKKLIEHLKLGKPIANKSRKPITESTAYKYNVWLSKLEGWFSKPFENLTENDIDSFRQKLSKDKIRQNNGEPYKESTKRDIEQKFLKVLLAFIGKPELALYSTAYKDDVEIPALSREEIETIVARNKLRDKVIFQLLFDGGFRAQEFLNIQFKDIKDDSLAESGYYKIRITKSKTKPRTVGLTLPLSTELIREWTKLHPEKKGTTEPFIELSYRHLNLTIRRRALKVLKKKITPHHLRHSSATYYCHHLNQYQMCKRYGWTMSSDMPRRYIDREGVEDEQVNKKIIDGEAINFRREVNKLQEQLSQQNEAFSEIKEELAKQILQDLIKDHGLEKLQKK